MQNEATPTKISFKLTGGSFTLTTLQLYSNNYDNLKQQLKAKIDQAPKFFQYAPIVIDLKYMSSCSENIKFVEIQKIIAEFKIIPIGIKNGSPQQIQEAKEQGLAILSDFSNKNDVKASLPSIHNQMPKSKLITAQVRSGQQLYAENGDLIIEGSVSPGAEILADGNIHVYGALRGRALAGINGNKEARIYCSKIEAQLISIAGIYKVIDDINPELIGHPSVIFIQNEELMLSRL